MNRRMASLPAPNTDKRVDDPWKVFERYLSGSMRHSNAREVETELDTKVLKSLLHIIIQPWFTEFLVFIARKQPEEEIEGARNSNSHSDAIPDPHDYRLIVEGQGDQNTRSSQRSQSKRKRILLRALQIFNLNLRFRPRNLSNPNDDILTFVRRLPILLHRLETQSVKIIVNGWEARSERQLKVISKLVLRFLLQLEGILAGDDNGLRALYNTSIIRDSDEKAEHKSALRGFQIASHASRRNDHPGALEESGSQERKRVYTDFLETVWSNVVLFCSRSSSPPPLGLTGASLETPYRRTTGKKVFTVTDFETNLVKLLELLEESSVAQHHSFILVPDAKPRDLTLTAEGAWEMIYTQSLSCICESIQTSQGPKPEVPLLASGGTRNIKYFELPDALQLQVDSETATAPTTSKQLHAKSLLKLDILDPELSIASRTATRVGDDHALLNRYSMLFAVAPSQASPYARYALQEVSIRIVRLRHSFNRILVGLSDSDSELQKLPAGALRQPLQHGEFCEQIQSHCGGLQNFRVELPVFKLGVTPEPGIGMPPSQSSVFIEDLSDAKIRMLSGMESDSMYLINLDMILKADNPTGRPDASEGARHLLDNELARPMLAYTLIKYIWQLFNLSDWINSDWTKYSIYWIGCSPFAERSKDGSTMTYICSGPYLSTIAKKDPRTIETYSHIHRNPGRQYCGHVAVFSLGITLFEIATGQSFLESEVDTPFRWNAKVSNQKMEALKALVEDKDLPILPGCSTKVSEAFRGAILACLDFNGREGGRKANEHRCFDRDVSLEECRAAFLKDVLLSLVERLSKALASDRNSLLAEALQVNDFSADRMANILNVGEFISFDPITANVAPENLSPKSHRVNPDWPDTGSNSPESIVPNSHVRDGDPQPAGSEPEPRPLKNRTTTEAANTIKTTEERIPIGTAPISTGNATSVEAPRRATGRWWDQVEDVHAAIVNFFNHHGTKLDETETPSSTHASGDLDEDALLPESKPPTQAQRSRVKVAIIDTGCAGVTDDTDLGFVPFFDAGSGADGEYQSGFIVDRIVGYKDFTSESSEFPIDIDGHGTRMAGLILSMAPRTDLYIARVMRDHTDIASEKDGRASECVRNIAKAIKHAVMNWDVDFISLSLGFEKKQDEIEQALREVEILRNPGTLAGTKKGLTIFVATTNDGMSCDTLYPASSRQAPLTILPIRGTDQNGGFDSAMNGSIDKQVDHLEFGTYGVDIDVTPFTKRSDIPKDSPPDFKLKKSGCSYATPIAVGWAALFLDIHIQTTDLTRLAETRCLLRSREGVYRLFEEVGRSSNNSKRLKFIGPFSEIKRTCGPLPVPHYEGISHILNNVLRRI